MLAKVIFFIAAAIVLEGQVPPYMCIADPPVAQGIVTKSITVCLLAS